VILSGYELEPLHDDGDFSLYRARKASHAVTMLALVAARPTSRSVARLVHEYRLAPFLDASWAAHPLALDPRREPPMLVLDDDGGEPLRRILRRPLELARVLRIAVNLAKVIGRVHQCGLIHKDIKPAHVLVDSNDRVRLTGFGIASQLPQEHQPPIPPEVVAGTFAYMAPEQTGRMNRSIDTRSDLYSLGVVLYEMLTGSLPFTASDPMEWIHCHIARRPPPPGERARGIPEPVERIVLKLLAKAAEDRYQTAAGVEADLRACVASWGTNHSIAPFALGLHDASDRLLIPEKLYGREAQIGNLVDAFERIVAGGATELVLIAGYAGIGKSSVVNELHKVLVPPRGLFAAGKFDQYKRDVPYATFAQAFQWLLRDLLSKSDTEIEPWREQLMEALAPNGQVMVNLIPELALIIGEQPPVPNLPPQDAQNLFHWVFRRFLGVFARAEHPLALFIDDLQWLDTATLELLEHLVTHPEVRHVLLIGAYRDNEVDASHPLARTLDSIRSAAGNVQQIVLEPLNARSIAQLASDALHCDGAPVEALAQLVHEKTGGNPFFTIQFLTALHDEGLIRFDHRAAVWTWDLPGIRAKGYTDNVADLMAAKLGRLSAETRDVLGQLACLGNVADVTALTWVQDKAEDKAEEVTNARMWEAIRSGLVFRVGSNYVFAHDRVQEAAYELIPAGERPAAHLRIGRALASHTPPEALHEAIFDIVNHLNRGAALIQSKTEREQAAALNLIAGKRAMSSTAYSSARSYLAQGVALLSDAAWDERYDSTLELYLAYLECEYLVGDFARADAVADLVLERAHDNLDRAKVFSLRMELYQLAGKYNESFAAALAALRDFGIVFPEADDELRAAVDDALLEVPINQAGRPTEELVDAPVAEDPASRAVINLLVEAMPCAFAARPVFYPLFTLKAVNLSLRHGNTDNSSFAYGNFALMLVSRIGDIPAAVQFSEMSLRLNEKFGNRRLYGKLLHLYCSHVNFWRCHIDENLPVFEQAAVACMEVGDLVFAGNLAFNAVWQSIEKGDALKDMHAHSARYATLMLESHNDAVHETIRIEQQFVASLRGLSSGMLTLNDDHFDEAACCEAIVKSNFGCGIGVYHIIKLMLAYLDGRYADALNAAAMADAVLSSVMALAIEPTFHFFHVLTLSALYADASAGQQQAYRQVITEKLEKFEMWARHCPANYGNRYSLVLAELARIDGRDVDAMHHYEDALRLARVHGFIQNQAMANELAARFHASRARATLADHYLADARSCYERWGAQGKVRQLESIYPQLRAELVDEEGSVATSVEQLDLATVVKVSESIFSGMDLNELIRKLMLLALEHAGANRGLLILARGDELRIEAEAETVGNTVAVRLPKSRPSAADLPMSILRYVARTRDILMLDDVTAPNPYSQDEYIRAHDCRSILCLPLVKLTRLIGVLYLENTLTVDVFSPAQTAVLRLLASQAALSLETLRLYADLQHAEALLTAAQELSHTGSFDWDVTGDAMFWSKESFRIFGYDASITPTLQLMLDRVHPDDLAFVRSAFDRAARDGQAFDIEHRLSMPDGSHGHLQVVAHVVADGPGQRRLVGALMDITTRKQAHAALARSEQRYRSLFRDIPVGLWQIEAQPLTAMLTELRGQGVDDLSAYISDHADWLERAKNTLVVEETNDHALQMFGATERRALLGPLPWVWKESPDTLRRALESRYRGDMLFQETTRLPTLDGRVIDVLLTVARPRTVDDLGIALISLVDLTERVRAQDMLQRLQADFAHAARISMLGELTASIAHELNQPLAAIAINCQVSERWLNRPVPELDEVRDTNQRIAADAQRAVDIIGRIRGMALRRGPKYTLEPLALLIDEALVFLRREIQTRDVQVSLELAPGVRRVRADRVQLQQVIVNLVVNAMQQMEQTGSPERRITIRTNAPDAGTLHCAIEDSGPGIAPEHMDRVFQSFFTTKEGGMGMGLPICRSIIDAHDGRIEADNLSVHGGARFHFTLPSAGAAP
jgi:PAS domain S-box-containing protein